MTEGQDFSQWDKYSGITKGMLDIIPELIVAFQKSTSINTFKKKKPEIQYSLDEVQALGEIVGISDLGTKEKWWLCNDYEELSWQVDQGIIPYLQIRLANAPKKFPLGATKDEKKRYVWETRKNINWYSVNYIFATMYFLSSIDPIMPYGRITLHKLLNPEWGEVVNSAAVLGLLNIGETNLDPYPLENLVIRRNAPIEKKIDELRCVEFMDYRVFQLKDIPKIYWNNALNTLSKIIKKDDILFQSLLYYAIGDDSNQSLGESIFVFCLNNGLFCPLTISWLLNLPSFPRQQRYDFLRNATMDDEFKEKYPEYALEVLEWIPRYSK